MPMIALVDDDKNILTSVTIALEAEGFHVRTYTDGATALTQVTRRKHDQVFGGGLAALVSGLAAGLPASPEGLAGAESVFADCL